MHSFLNKVNDFTHVLKYTFSTWDLSVTITN